MLLLEKGILSITSQKVHFTKMETEVQKYGPNVYLCRLVFRLDAQENSKSWEIGSKYMRGRGPVDGALTIRAGWEMVYLVL